MNAIRWIPIVERAPPPDTYVIFSHEEPGGKTFVSPGWVQPDEYCWSFYRISDGFRQGTLCFVEMSATDFWLPIPTEHPQHNVVDGGYPA